MPEYWLSSLKIATVIVFIIVGVAVNSGFNSEHRYIGTSNWRIPGAPFVGGFGGFSQVFVIASFACASHPVLLNRFDISLIRNSWRDGKLGYHSRGDEKSVTKYAENR